jgi:hypothetical protein
MSVDEHLQALQRVIDVGRAADVFDDLLRDLALLDHHGVARALAR